MKNKSLLILLYSFISSFPLLNAQSIGDYRTAATGNWSAASTWETYNGLMWAPALLSPSSLNGAINVRNGHTVTVNANTTVDQLTIDAGATLVLAANTLTLDVLALGNLYCSGSLELNGGNLNMNITNGVVVNGSMSWTDGDLVAGTVDINNGAILTLSGSATKDLQSASIDINSGAVLNWDDGNINLNVLGGINNNGTINTSCNASISGLGTFNNNSGGIFSKTSTGTTTFNVIVTSILGTFKGVGTYNFNNLFLNAGTISPGLSPGIVIVTYSDLDPVNYPLLGTNSDLDIEIKDGTGPGTGHDQIIRDNSITLGGTLRVTETGTVPDGSYAIVIVTAGTISGTFTNVILPVGYTLTITTSIVLVTKVSTLPVKLVNFTAKKINDNAIQLDWQTVNEDNSDRFEVERSRPNGAFIKIGEVNAAGYSNQLQRYQFIDNYPDKGLNIYRLKQVDKNNKFEYSPVRLIKNEDAKDHLYIFPTVTNGMLFIQSNEETVVELYNLQSTRLLMKEIYNKGQIDLSNYAAGLYILRNKKDGKSYKIIKR